MSSAQMTSLKTKRAGAAGLTAPEEIGEETSLMMCQEDMAGKFQMNRPVKFNYEKGKMAYWTHTTFECVWILWEIFLLISAILGLTFVSPAAVWPYSTWTWFLTATVGVMTLWLTAAIICGLRNRFATDRGASELPCMELRHTISYTIVLWAGWAVALGFMADLYADRNDQDTTPQQQSYITKLWIVVLVASLNLLDPLRHIFGVTRDRILIACKSTCYDL